jgi:hypothetical protein
MEGLHSSIDANLSPAGQAEEEPFKGLPAELWNEVLSHFNETSALKSLSEASRCLWNQAAPKLYASLQYHEKQHSLKSLICFFRTILIRRDLALYIHTLDIRNWVTIDSLYQQTAESRDVKPSRRKKTNQLDPRKSNRSITNSLNACRCSEKCCSISFPRPTF